MLEKAEQLKRRHKDLRGKISLARLKNNKAFILIRTRLVIMLTMLKNYRANSLYFRHEMITSWGQREIASCGKILHNQVHCVGILLSCATSGMSHRERQDVRLAGPFICSGA